MHKMTLNPGHGSAVEVAGLGLFRRGDPREVELSKAHLEQFQRGNMWTLQASPPLAVEEAKKTKAATGKTKKAKE